MNSKKMIIATISLLLCALLMTGTINFIVDPLFQYHKPWLGLEPVVTNERYQNAGIAKNFDFENVVIGNSMSQNFIVSDVEKAFGGTTVKLTASGSHILDWTYLLNILSKKQSHPKNILFNLDTGFFDASDNKTKHQLPTFLYDYNYLNDVEYLFNFTLMRNYTFETIKANLDNSIPDYNEIFVWQNENELGKEFVLKNYVAPESKTDNSMKKFYTQGNLQLLQKYIEEMPDTQFVFFCSPFSVLYWKEIVDSNQLSSYKSEFEKTFDFMSQYDNVTVYFWTDEEMLDIISDLNNYRDSSHYSFYISKDIIQRIDNNFGILPKEKQLWMPLLTDFFNYLENFDYNSIF